MPDMIVTARTCRYDGHEYRQGETIRNVAVNHARVLTTLRKAQLKTGPIGHVGSTVAAPPAPSQGEADFTADLEPAAAVIAEAAPEPEPEPEPEPASDPAPAAPKRGRYRNRALRSDAD